jgi:hypothetical protein
MNTEIARKGDRSFASLRIQMIVGPGLRRGDSGGN